MDDNDRTMGLSDDQIRVNLKRLFGMARPVDEGLFTLGWSAKCQEQKSQFLLLSIAQWLTASLRPQANDYKTFNKMTNDEEEIP